MRRGFTLIELLVAIAIVAILAAILFPVFARVREKARQTSCLSDLSQIARAAEMYAADYSGFIVNWCVTHPNPMNPPPLPIGQERPDPSLATWDVSIMRYLKNSSTLRCPSNPFGREARSYAITRYTQRPAGVNFFGGFAGDVRNPSGVVLFFEKGHNPPGSWGDALAENFYQAKGPDLDPGRMWHNEGKNLLFLDGHAKWYARGAGPFGHNEGSCERWEADWPPPN